MVGVQKISWYTNFFQTSVFLKLGLVPQFGSKQPKKGVKQELLFNFGQNSTFF